MGTGETELSKWCTFLKQMRIDFVLHDTQLRVDGKHLCAEHRTDLILDFDTPDLDLKVIRHWNADED